MENVSDYTHTAAVAAAVISGIGLIVQVGLGVYNNKQIKKLEQKKLDADLISKSRIAWIQNVKGILSEYITVLYSVRHYSLEFATNYTDVYTKEESGKLSDDKIQEAIRLRELLLLNLSESPEHKEFTDTILKTYYLVRDYKKDPIKYDSRELNKEIENLTSIGRNYFKNEWDKAKKGQ